MNAETMDEATLEKYVDWLDELERTDPAAYQQVMTTMKMQLEAARVDPSSERTDNDEALLDMLKSNTKKQSLDDPATDFKPRFPGDKIMEPGGLTVKQEGMYIDVSPGFVMKTTEIKTKKKVFVNVCHSNAIQSFSQQKKLDDEGNEQEGIHVPLSLGAPHEVKDKKGNTSLAFDVAVNTQVVEDCQNDKTGSFRNFVCELAIEYIDQKYKIKLDPRYKLPRLAYRGELPPSKHYIRKTQTPLIQEVSTTTSTPSTTKNATTVDASEKPSIVPNKTSIACYEIYEEQRNVAVQDRPVTKRPCDRLPSTEKKGTALSPEVLAQALTHLTVAVSFQVPISNSNDVQLELSAEYIVVKALDHEDLNIFLPYPVAVSSAHVRLDRTANQLLLTATIDKSWDIANPDIGSALWLLAQALKEDENDPSLSRSTNKPGQHANAKGKSLAELFHLSPPVAQPGNRKIDDVHATARVTRWDPVDDDEELPEDRFHKKDMMSMHILEQRKLEREQKVKDAELKRKQKRKEIEEMRRKAEEAGKTWREMYPNEPETTYIDMEDIVQQEKAKRDKCSSIKELEQATSLTYTPTQEARKAAAAWSESSKQGGLDLKSALAFELLD